MDDTIRDLLDSAAPDQPALPAAARADAVRGRARAVRRRNGLVLAAAVTAVVGVGVAVPVLGSDSGDSRVGVAGDPTPQVLAPPPCPAEPVDVMSGVAVEALPDGAISARVCAVADLPLGGTTPRGGFRPPPDLPDEPLVDGVDDFTAAVRGLPAYTLEDECAFTTMMLDPWAVVVSYPDGSSATLGSGTRACAAVSVEGTDRSAAEILELFVAASGGPAATP